MDYRNFRIILPAKPTELESFAAKEFAYFTYLATGVVLFLAYDYEPQAEFCKEFISIGETKRFNERYDIKQLKKDVKADGYKVVMNKSEAYVCGGAGQGTIYGVYEILKALFNLEIYADDEFVYDKKDMEFFDFERTCFPDIPMRAVGIGDVHMERRYPAKGDKKYIYRMRLRQMDEGWGINNHTYFRILPPIKYQKEHPDWYDKEVKTICYSNQEMIAQYVENMKSIIEHTPNDSLYMIGMEDNVSLCDCEGCQELLKKYNGNQVATMLHFTNSVVKKLNIWLKEKYPERVVYFFAFAYNWAELPPVKKTDSGEYISLFPELNLEDNLGVLIACIHGNANYPLDDERDLVAIDKTYHSGKRIPAKELYKGWNAVVKHVASWNYNLNFYDFECPCPMWNFLENSTFKFLKSVGTLHMFLEAGCSNVHSNFAKMKIYCVSKLMWDNSLDLHELISDFMKVYYKGAEKEVMEYFNFIHKHAGWLNTKLNRQMIHVHFDDEPNLRIMDKRFFPLEMLNESLEIFDRALSHDVSDKVKDRVLLETLSVKYTMLYLYRFEIDKNLALKLIKDLRYLIDKMGVADVQDFRPKTLGENLDIFEKELLG